MPTRRGFFVAGCAACAALASIRLSNVATAGTATAEEIHEPGYLLRFIGSVRETIMAGKRAALLDLSTLKGRPHLYGLGPLEGLVGEVTIADGRPALARVGVDHMVHVTESYDGGVPFFVWAEVPVWQAIPVPSDISSYSALEAFVGEAGKRAGLAQAFPFVVAGRPRLIEFHIVDAKSDTPSGMGLIKRFKFHSRYIGRK